jgi:hypothetical protein
MPSYSHAYRLICIQKAFPTTLFVSFLPSCLGGRNHPQYVQESSIKVVLPSYILRIIMANI